MRNMIIALFAFSLLLFGCIDLGGEAPKNETNVTPPAPPPPAPSFAVMSPMNGQSLTAVNNTADVNIVLSTSNLIIKPTSSSVKVGEGHFRLSLDNGAYVSFFSKTYLLQSVPVGNHTVAIELVNNDNTAYSPSITRSVSFEVKPSAPLVYVPKDYTVEINDFTYNPSDLTVKVGDSVTWKNIGSYPRSATCFISGKEMFDTNVLGPGTSATITMGEELECEYYSVTHMAMKGNITVEANTTG